jgi:uncharacterized protein YegJ (DUF2314 family)
MRIPKRQGSNKSWWRGGKVEIGMRFLFIFPFEMKKFNRRSLWFRGADVLRCIMHRLHGHRPFNQHSKHFLFCCCGIVFVLLTACSSGQPNVGTPTPLAENAPLDQLFPATEGDRLDSLTAPYKAEARRTLPESKKRYLNGLNPGEVYFVSTRICDQESDCEDVFIEVTKWENDQIEGLLANQVQTVDGYVYGQMMHLSEQDVHDWTISKPDGTKEGNYVGKFLDTMLE